MMTHDKRMLAHDAYQAGLRAKLPGMLFGFLCVVGCTMIATAAVSSFIMGPRYERDVAELQAMQLRMVQVGYDDCRSDLFGTFNPNR